MLDHDSAQIMVFTKGVEYSVGINEWFISNLSKCLQILFTWPVIPCNFRSPFYKGKLNRQWHPPCPKSETIDNIKWKLFINKLNPYAYTYIDSFMNEIRIIQFVLLWHVTFGEFCQFQHLGDDFLFIVSIAKVHQSGNDTVNDGNVSRLQNLQNNNQQMSFHSFKLFWGPLHPFIPWPLQLEIEGLHDPQWVSP